MSLEALRARLERLLADRGGDPRGYAQGIYQAMLDTKVAVAEVRDALAATRAELAGERQRLSDAERRGRLAGQIGDQETADLAGIWVAKHTERVGLLERKLAVQEDELRYAERQLDELGAEYRKARAGMTGGGPPPPTLDPELDLAGLELEQKARETQVQDQLAELKRKLGRQE